jgi:sn-glycerol 3-phosphate transport system permease protein
VADITASAAMMEREPATLARPRLHRYRHIVAAYALLLPSLAALALFTYGPVLQVMWDALHLRPAPGAPPAFGGLRNFQAVFADARAPCASTISCGRPSSCRC